MGGQMVSQFIAEKANQYDPVLIADGQGGAIFAWWDISTPDWNIYAQRLSADGKSMWNAGDGAENAPIPVCTARGNQGAPVVVNDKNGGVFFVWSDYRNDPNFYTSAQLYAQHLTAKGDALWEKDGIPICKLRGQSTTTRLHSGWQRRLHCYMVGRTKYLRRYLCTAY